MSEKEALEGSIPVSYVWATRQAFTILLQNGDGYGTRDPAFRLQRKIVRNHYRIVQIKACAHLNNVDTLSKANLSTGQRTLCTAGSSAAKQIYQSPFPRLSTTGKITAKKNP